MLERSRQVVATGRRLLVFGGFRDVLPVNPGDPSREAALDGIIYGF